MTPTAGTVAGPVEAAGAKAKGGGPKIIKLINCRKFHMRKSEPPRGEGMNDEKFLDTIRNLVFQKLFAGEMELKLEYGFKAIELKQKIADGTQNEKLLLEILNEIRKEELAKANE